MKLTVIEALEAEVVRDQSNLEKKREALRLLKGADGRLEEVPGLICYGAVTMEPRILFDIYAATFSDEGFELIFNSRERDTGVEQYARRSGLWNGLFADLPEPERNYRRMLFAFGDAFTHELQECVKIDGQRKDPHETER